MFAVCYQRARLALLACLALSTLAASAAAQPPDTLRGYRFVPRLSTLNESGGIGGWSTDFKVLGTFGLAERWSVERPVLNHTISFVDVDAWAAHPILAYVLNLDDVLGLSKLKGEALPVGAPFDVFKFTGENDQGVPVDLYAAQIGRWLLLKGETTPPCCDYFKYSLRAVARQMSYADLTNDGVVDRADFGAWADRYGQMAPHDATGNGRYGGGDFLALQQQLGEDPPDFAAADSMLAAMIAAGSANVASVPEPWGLGLAVAGGAVLAVALRRRR